MLFKEIERYGDLTNVKYEKSIFCYSNKLTSLKGCPKEIKGDFDYSFNNLKTLEYSPKIIGGNFNSNNNELTSLKDCSKLIKGNFYFSNNNLIKIREQIIKYQIKAVTYYTDEGIFFFKEIEEEFNNYKNKLLLLKKTKENKKQINTINIDYGLSI